MAMSSRFIVAFIAIVVAIIHQTAQGHQQAEIIFQKCLLKADSQNVTIKCGGPEEMIVIHQAFFTSSVVDYCPFATIGIKNGTSQDKPGSCTDDLRLTLNSRCSRKTSCSVNISKLHYPLCPGFDGWINIKYACLTRNRLTSYCNLQLSENRGYVSNPGYPEFYPPYDCKWNIVGFTGQRIQIEILDLQLREPRFVSKKHIPYECIDSVAIIDNGIRIFNLCGETKTNLIDYRSKTNELTIQFRSLDFSPTRGLLFRYSMIDCPTLKPPSNGYMYRNQSFAIYHCYFDYVFEDTGLPIKTLICEEESHWNGTVTRCIPKEKLMTAEKAFALSHHPSGIDDDDEKMEQIDEIVTVNHIDLEKMTRPAFMWLIILGLLSLLCIIMIFVGIMVHYSRGRRNHHNISF